MGIQNACSFKKWSDSTNIKSRCQVAIKVSEHSEHLYSCHGELLTVRLWITLGKALLCLYCIIWFFNNPMGRELWLYPFHRWNNWGLFKLVTIQSLTACRGWNQVSLTLNATLWTNFLCNLLQLFEGEWFLVGRFKTKGIPLIFNFYYSFAKIWRHMLIYVIYIYTHTHTYMYIHTHIKHMINTIKLINICSYMHTYISPPACMPLFRILKMCIWYFAFYFLDK